MTREQWESYIKRLDNCPNDCDTCGIRESCVKTYEKHLNQCKFKDRRHEIHAGSTPDNPQVTGCALRVIKLTPLSMHHVHGLPIIGDGSHRKWRVK
jgi:hypothetical protein